MPNNQDIWLRKIAAFLHDPPDKAFWHESREVDALRFWFWVSELRVEPFYFSKSSPVRKTKAWQKECFETQWDKVVEAISSDLYGYSKLIGIICEKNGGTRERFPREILKNYFRRDFHNIASSQSRYHLFGFENIGDVKEIMLYHTLDTSSKIDAIKLVAEMRKETNKSQTEGEQDRIPLIHIRSDLKERVSSSAPKTPFERFLILWRKRHWISTISPADTRIPDHPVVDLETMQSAIATTLDKDLKVKASFLIFEFGPVQSFIVNARKTRDLWFSSWLISYLAWAAMKPIAEELGPDNIVYPDLYKQPLVDNWLIGKNIKDLDSPNIAMPTLPNTFLAIMPEGREEEFVQKARSELENAWNKMCKKTPELETKLKDENNNFLKLKDIWGESFTQIFLAETKKFHFDTYWLGLKWGTKPEKAIEDYKKLLEPGKCWEFERLWKEIKNRVKSPNIGDTYALLVEMAQTGLKALKYRGTPKVVEEPGYKCSLCGERTALTDGDPTDIKGIKKFWKQMADAFPGHIKENEHLCAVCLVKRLAPKVIYESLREKNKDKRQKFFDSDKVTTDNFDYHYPSTGSIAIAPFIQKLMVNKINLSPLSKAIEQLLNEAKDEKEKQHVKNFLDAHFTEGRTAPGISQRILKEEIEGERFLGDFEPEWFHDESFQRFYDELNYKKDQKLMTEDEFEKQKDWAEKIEQAVTKIKNEAKNKLQDKYYLPKYYAAVYLDGDDLGKWVRGEFAPKIGEIFHPDFVKKIYEKDKKQDEKIRESFEAIKDLKRPVTPAIHRAISSALRDFALEVVPYIVEENLGVVVYSGGDDTLFLMPLENLFKTLATLRKLYSGEKFIYSTDERRFDSDKGFIKIYENDKLKNIIRVMGTKATLSAGVAIAHYLDPLDITLSKARGMLEKAKKKTNKNERKNDENDSNDQLGWESKEKNKAGFKVLVHSGSERKSIVPWEFVEWMDKFREAITNGFSSRFIRTLFREIRVYEKLPDAFDAEFLKFGTRGQSDYKPLLCDLIEARKQNNLSPKDFIEALLIADFLVREEGSK